MHRRYWNDFSNALIDRATHDASALDSGTDDTAAMVLVGDVYTLLVCHGESPAEDGRRRLAPPAAEDELSPFIR